MLTGMSEQSVTLAPGQVTTISTGMAAGTTIYNGDANNAAWVSGNPVPGPGSGMRIGPKGSLEWTTAGPVYGAVDAGVTAPIVLTASSNVGSLVNPVDVGAAVATQLLNQGVPNVLQGALLSTGAAVTSPYTVPGNVSKYASLSVYLFSSTIPVTYTFRWFRSGQLMDTYAYDVAGGGVPLIVDITVRGDRLDILWTPAANVTPVVYASNRTVPEGVLANTLPVTANVTQAFTNGSRVTLISGYRSNGRPAYLRFVVTGTGQGILGFAINNAGAVTPLDIADSKAGVAGSDGQEVEKYVTIPPGVTDISFSPRVTGSYTVVAALIPQPL